MIIINILNIILYSANPNCNLGDLRLVNGQNNMEGRIEICFNGIWGTIADDNWHNADAKVACRHLGFAANGQCICLLLIIIM